MEDGSGYGKKMIEEDIINSLKEIPSMSRKSPPVFITQNIGDGRVAGIAAAHLSKCFASKPNVI